MSLNSPRCMELALFMTVEPMDTRMPDPSVAIEALVAGMLLWRVGRLGRELVEERNRHSTWKVTGCCKRTERKTFRIVAEVGVFLDAFDHLWNMAPYDSGIPRRRLHRAMAILWADMVVASHADETLDVMLEGPKVFECGMLQ